MAAFTATDSAAAAAKLFELTTAVAQLFEFAAAEPFKLTGVGAQLFQWDYTAALPFV